MHVRHRQYLVTDVASPDLCEDRSGQTLVNLVCLDDDAAHVRREIDTFLIANWPFGAPILRLYYDPRTVEPTSTASLHAKCIVVDDRRALVTSANFTSRGQERNVEVGVLVESEKFARELFHQWRNAAEAGVFVRPEAASGR
jgi:phosphatidylserine/phosphatidylglycerophosphate/cardiolipin synthase-like enzyme